MNIAIQVAQTDVEEAVVKVVAVLATQIVKVIPISTIQVTIVKLVGIIVQDVRGSVQELVLVHARGEHIK